MSLSIKKDLTLRTEIQNRLTLTEIDENLIQTQALSLASSNSLIYLSDSFSVDSNTPLADPALKSFNSRTIPSFLYKPFENGCRFVFKFSNTDYGYLGSASSTHLWWSVLAGDISYKVLSISQINSFTSSTTYPSYNNWDFNLTSLSFTNSTWTVTGTKIMGPTFSDFEPESIFSVGYKSMLSPTFSGGTGSIGGVVDGYTYFDYPTLQNRMYIGDLSYQIEIGITGSIGATGATGGTGSIVTVGGEGMLVKKMYFGDLDTQKSIGLTSGNDMMGAGIEMEFLYLGHISIVDLMPGDGPVTQACCGKRKPRSRAKPPEHNIGGKYDFRPAASNSELEIVYDYPIDYYEITSHATNSQGYDNFVGIHVGALAIGLTESRTIEMVVLDRGNPAGNWNKPNTVLGIGTYLTSSNGNFFDSAGIDSYAMSTSYLEITPITYSLGNENILLNGTWGTESGGTYSVLNIDSDGVSVNKLYFGNITNNQSLYVSGGDLYVNDVVFSGGVTGPQGETGPQGFDGVTGPQGETGPQGSNGVNGSDGPNSIRLIFGDTSGSAPTGTGLFNTTGGPSFSDVTFINFNTPPYTDVNGASIYDWLDNAITDRLANGTIRAQISEVGNPSNYGIYVAVPNTPSPNASWSLTFVTGNGTFSADKIYTISSVSGGLRGITGSQGPTGADGLIVGTAIPASSADPGSKGEIRVDDGQYLYIHTGDQWLKSSMTFSTF